MDIEDVQEKTRRNLVAFSTAVWAIVWLEAPIKGTFFGVVDVQSVSPVRAWTAILIILSYLMLRFHQFSDTSRERRLWPQAIREKRDRFVMALVERAINNSVRAGYPLVGIQIRGLLPTSPEWTFQHIQSVNGDQFIASGWSGPIGCRWIGVRYTKYAHTYYVHKSEYKVLRLARWGIVLKTIWSEVITSHRLLEIALPYALGLSTAALAGVQISKALASS